MLFFRKHIQGLGPCRRAKTADCTEKHPLYYTTSMRGCTVQIAGSGDFLAVLRPLPTNLRAKLYGWAEQCVNILRINNAKQLISTTDLPFSEIAYLVGIEDRYYFSKLFRKMTGMSPTEYYKEVRS